MAYLDIEEMTTHIYAEDMDTISHGDDAAMLSAIDYAIGEVRGYLGKYDADRIFAARGKERNPILLLFVKDVAAWHFCNVCNAGVDIEMREKRYDRAIEWLKNNQNRKNPDLPAAPDNTGDHCQRCRADIAFGSNRKRDNHF